MKKLKLILLLTAFTGVLFTSCEKSIDVTPEASPKTLLELNAPADFNWSTALPVDVQITGLPTTIPVKSTLTISLTDGTPLFNQFHLMNLDLKLRLIVPSTEKELILKYGSDIHHLIIVNNQASFSFIPATEEN